MRLLFFITYFAATLVLSNCAHSNQTANQQASHAKFDFSVGDISQRQLKTKHAGFFHADDYSSPSKQVKQLKQVNEEISLVTYFGVWCHDSQREVPRMLKLLDRVANSHISHQMIALDYQKTEPHGRATAASIVSTPTFVVLKEGIEIGRIVETPNSSLAADLLAIINR